MDPDYLERKRRYEQQIFKAINDRPQQFIDARLSSDADDWRKWRMKAGSANAHHAMPRHAATGAELQWHAPVEDWEEYHTLVRLTPEDEAAYRRDPRFQNFDEFGRRYATLGAGPMPVSGALAGLADLASFANQERDVAPHPAGIPVEPLPGMSADDYIDLLLRADREYTDDLPYAIWPWPEEVVDGGRFGPVHIRPAYNSNGYVSGLLKASGVTPPALPVTAPGYRYPVPPAAFGK